MSTMTKSVSKKYYQNHREEILWKAKPYYLKNKEKFKERVKSRRARLRAEGKGWKEILNI